MIDLDLSGRVAFVTGASKGIGNASVRLLADHGATVGFCARGPEAVFELSAYRPPSGSGSVHGYFGDMSEVDAVQEILELATSQMGPINILVNNVGASPSRNFLYMSDDDWTSLHELNLMSAVRCTRFCLPHMREQKWGRVIMIASGAAFTPNAALIDYAATKAAMVATAKALAGKYGADNVLTNTVIPGLIRTDMWERAAAEIAEANDTDAEAIFARNSTGVPQGRYGTSEEVASGVVFLASNAANYINGTCLTIDGGVGTHV
ncbi:SDR family NAD(P)-dependent oxidoreductase [Candidatus Poriferisodalis sp.]|uniref:SDR family NAD(P)-dependent oxidoreductase n=1 Tax=Candidatus Poriferisodalis sp. TaxID=3101277 RepID=UPI003B01C6D8